MPHISVRLPLAAAGAALLGAWMELSTAWDLADALTGLPVLLRLPAWCAGPQGRLRQRESGEDPAVRAVASGPDAQTEHRH